MNNVSAQCHHCHQTFVLCFAKDLESFKEAEFRAKVKLMLGTKKASYLKSPIKISISPYFWMQQKKTQRHFLRISSPFPSTSPTLLSPRYNYSNSKRMRRHFWVDSQKVPIFFVEKKKIPEFFCCWDPGASNLGCSVSIFGWWVFFGCFFWGGRFVGCPVGAIFAEILHLKSIPEFGETKMGMAAWLYGFTMVQQKAIDGTGWC